MGAGSRRGGEKRDAGGRRKRNGGSSDSSSRDGTPYVHRLGYKTLEELSGKDPAQVAITLSSNPALQVLLDETEMRQDLVQLLCYVLCRAFQAQTDRATLQHLADTVKNSGFLRTILPHYVANMASESNPDRRDQYPLHLDNILAVVFEVLKTFPASSVQSVSMLVMLLQASINNLRASGVDISPQTDEKLQQLQGLVNHLQEKSREGTLRSDKDTYSLLHAAGENPGAEDQQNFRTLPIYPTPEEFHEEQRPFLRPNLTSQHYASTHVYLDTHFRLLREDFVRPLREGIQQLLRNQRDMGRNDNPLKNARFDDIRVYFDTRLVVPKCTLDGIAIIVQFDPQPLQFVRWENSKRLLYGSLVCLSCDNFETFLFATVSNREPEELKNGRVQLIFSAESREKLVTIQTDQSFLMVETTAYFEAYRYVLEGLQEQEEAHLPFQRYIVDCQSDVHPPAYLNNGDSYKLSDIADPEYKGKIQPFHCLKPEAWPKMEELGLDESQMRALQLALTKELAIIQGPPGTGKTYCGLKIAQALLTNESLWRSELIGNAPMLVVCYTNHALDQFLEGIHKFLPDGIVRVGGRSSSEVLKRFNLRELTHSLKSRRSMPRHLSSAYTEIYSELNQEEIEIQSQAVKLECSLKGVIREAFLERFISEEHWLSLQHCPAVHNQDDFEIFGEKKKKPCLIMEWLGIGSTVFQQRATEEANMNTAMETEEEDDEMIDIAEEADLIQAERFIEDTDHRSDRDKEKARVMEETLREVQEMMLATMFEDTEIQAEQSEDGFQMQRQQIKKMKNKIKKELGKSSAMSGEEEETIWDVWALGLPDRWRLYRLWIARYRVEMRTKALQSEQAYQNAVDRLADVRRHESLCVLKAATVIGMTTTGAAKFRKALQEVQPRLVIVEEAAEVLEAHTITTLSQACQHLILIGDHQQLRPSATVYELAKNFNLEVSMFERLIKMNFPFVRLNYQHRMRPDIACLLTPHIYDELQNHPSVFDYENIKGLKANLFFVEHTHPEEEIRDGKSHQNKHEAKFVVSLCQYLLFQGYKPEQITILTTYTGQFQCLRTLMPSKAFQGVKVHVVDKYQGEENDIVLLSLVRSNKQGKVGFLNIPNRVCVALSRAKKGLYCIGNSAMLGKVKLWSNIFHTLRGKGQMGTALTLCCQNHPDRQITASCAADFDKAPEGGCTIPCEFRLECGHVCASVCHPYDPDHKKYKCLKKCQKVLCDLNHRCPYDCQKACPKECPVKVEKTIPKCQHKQMMPCHQDPEKFVCQEPCQKTLQCLHPCTSVCGAPCTSKCMVKVTITLKCGHNKSDSCYYKTAEDEPNCSAPCNQQLKCGHTCKGTCHRCHQGRYHHLCAYRCERLLICSHKCREPCLPDCPSCSRPCENRCIHSKCKNKCGQPCAPCIERCAWRCPHQRCTKLCHEPCDRLPCDQPCDKILDCRHPCIGLCGEKCPNRCRICHRDEVTEIFFGSEDDPDALFVQLEDCGHIIESSAMDTYMGMDDNKQANEGEEVAIKLKECPKCRTPIRKNLRYGTHINRSLSEIEKVKEKINGCPTDIAQKKMTLVKQWGEKMKLQLYVQREYLKIEDELSARHLTEKDLWVLENKMAFLERVAKFKKIQREQMSRVQGVCFEAKVDTFVMWLLDAKQKFSNQQVSDLESELQRLTLLAELEARCSMRRGESVIVDHEIEVIRRVLEKLGPFTEQDEVHVKQGLKDLKIPSLGISEDERKMIVSAMKLQPGHWYKCPNGHVYVITECGGANESRQCTECNATIGGENHRLATGNQVASEMDGSEHPAWSEANNLLNFDLINFN